MEASLHGAYAAPYPRTQKIGRMQALVTAPQHTLRTPTMPPEWKPPEFMTSAELEEAIRKHRERTKKLLEEVRARREAEKKQQQKDDPND